MQRNTLNRQRGVTFVELVIVLAILAVVLGATLPGLGRLLDRQRLHGAAAQLETELQFARSLAVADSRPVRISFQADEAQSCYVIHTGGPGDCRCDGAVTQCRAGAEEVRSVRFDAASRLRGTSNSASMLFDPVKGTVTPTATMKLSNAQGDRVHLVISIMGRIRSCSPSGLPGHAAC